MQVKN